MLEYEHSEYHYLLESILLTLFGLARVRSDKLDRLGKIPIVRFHLLKNYLDLYLSQKVNPVVLFPF